LEFAEFRSFERVVLPVTLSVRHGHETFNTHRSSLAEEPDFYIMAK